MPSARRGLRLTPDAANEINPTYTRLYYRLDEPDTPDVIRAVADASLEAVVNNSDLFYYNKRSYRLEQQDGMLESWLVVRRGERTDFERRWTAWLAMFFLLCTPYLRLYAAESLTYVLLSALTLCIISLISLFQAYPLQRYTSVFANSQRPIEKHTDTDVVIVCVVIVMALPILLVTVV